jgi:type VI protein secretion system component Hcp
VAEDSRDVLMMLELTPGKFVPAECKAVLDPADPLAAESDVPRKRNKMSAGRFFAIEDFTLDAGLASRHAVEAVAKRKEERDQIEKTIAQVNDAIAALQDQYGQLNRRVMELHQMVIDLYRRLRETPMSGDALNGDAGEPASEVKSPKGGSGTYSRFLSEGRACLGGANGAFVSDIEPVSISKRLDRSSTTLLERCMTSFKFNSATIIKRRAIGQGKLRGFVRFDFYDVMLTELNWDDDDVTKESFRFVCRGVVVQYSAETFSSASNAAVLTAGSPAQWKVLETAR